MIINYLYSWFPFKYTIYESLDIPVNKRNGSDIIKVGLLTNEIPPIIYGGVATWIVNFINMFKDDDKIEVIPIYLAYNDKLPEECKDIYTNIRVIETSDDIGHSAVVTGDLPETLYSYHLVRLSFEKNIDLNYKRFLFNNPKILYDFSRKAKRVTRMTLSLEDFNNTEVRLPISLTEQKEIASELSIIIDNHIKSNEKIEASKSLQKSLINLIF